MSRPARIAVFSAILVVTVGGGIALLVATDKDIAGYALGLVGLAISLYGLVSGGGREKARSISARDRSVAAESIHAENITTGDTTRD